MAMGSTLQLASALAGLNALLLLALIGVWARNYATFRTTLVLGLLGFAVVMLVENAAALYFFVSMRSLYAMEPGVAQFVLFLRGLQFVAIAILTYVTVK
jgi:hypothetical protein